MIAVLLAGIASALLAPLMHLIAGTPIVAAVELMVLAQLLGHTALRAGLAADAVAMISLAQRLAAAMADLMLLTDVLL